MLIFYLQTLNLQKLVGNSVSNLLNDDYHIIIIYPPTTF